VASNLVAVQASHISTKPPVGHPDPSSNPSCPAEPQTTDISLLLWVFVVPGHNLFVALLNLIEPSEAMQDYHFAALYFVATLIQVANLLTLTKHFVQWHWDHGIVPDIAAIPYITSLGDLLRGLLLSAAFYLHIVTKY